MTGASFPGPHVVRLDAVDAVDAVAGSAAWLTVPERARRDALLDPRDRAAYVAAHLLVRVCVAALVGGAPDDVVVVQECPGCGRPGHGRPRVAGRPDVAVSLAHTRTWVAATAVGGGAAVGIDVEDVQPVPGAAFSPRERAWLAAQPDIDHAATALWVRKEALVKAGAGELAAVADLDVLDAAGRAPAGTVRERTVRAITAPPGAVAAWAWRLRPPRPPARSSDDGAAWCPPSVRRPGA